MREVGVGCAFEGFEELVVGGDKDRLRVFGKGQKEGIVDDHSRLECNLGGTRHQVFGRVQDDRIQSKLLPETTHTVER